MSGYQVSAVAGREVDAVWPKIDAMVTRGLEAIHDDTTTSALLREGVRHGRLVLWIVHSGDEIVAAIVLNIVKRFGGPVLLVVMIAGRDFEAWAPQVQQLLQDYRQLIGATRIESVSRPGMEKWMRRLGWRRRAVMMEWKEPPSTEASAEGVTGAVQRGEDHG